MTPRNLIAAPSVIPRGPRPAAVAALFIILLAALCARPLTAETFFNADTGFLSNLPEIATSGPRPSATAALDALLLIVSMIAFLLPLPDRRVSRRRRYCPGRVDCRHRALVNIRLRQEHAAIAGGNIACTVIAAAAMHRLLRTPWLARLALAALIATGGTLASKCILQISGEFAETREYWEQEQRPQLEKAGVDLTAPTIINYERRLASNEAMGFLALSNLAASCLMMCLFPVIGLLAASFAAGPQSGRSAADKWAVRFVLLCAAAGLLIALSFTGSTGAFAATVAGLATFTVLGAFRNQIGQRALLVTLSAAALYIGGMAAVGAYGAAKGTLPHSSLAFRWHYWSTTPDTLRDGWPTGLGRENFQASYLRHKPIESPEETRDPHNLWLSLLIELGPTGLAAGAVLLGLLIYSALRPLAVVPHTSVPAAIESAEAAGLYLRVAAALAVTFLLIHGCLSGSFFSPPHFVFWVIQVAAIWVLLFTVCCGLLRESSYGPLNTHWLTAGLAAGLCAALVHALVDFALLTPAGLAIFACLGVLATRRYEAPASAESPATLPPPRPSATLPTALLIAVALQFAFVTIPTINAENARDALRADLGRAERLEDAEAAITRAAASINKDRLGDLFPRTLASAARQLARSTELPADRQLAWLQRAAEWAAEAHRRNPRSLTPIQDLANIHAATAEVYAALDNEPDELAALRIAADFARQAVDAYPTNPRLRITAGIAAYEVWRLTHAESDARAATDFLKAAIELDDCRPPEEVVRLRAAERQNVADHLSWLAAGLHPATTQSAGGP